MTPSKREPITGSRRAADNTGTAVPANRLSRLIGLGGLAGGIFGSVMASGVREIASGRRPRASGLLLTPKNARKVADHLSRIRGAAMKVGQLLSMDADDVLPPEIAAALERLREKADPMPPKQLRSVLNAEWGETWLGRFAHFNVRPIAAASIGQVHRATLKDGRDLAIKVQYPGIRGAIDSDVENVAAFLRYSGVLPSGMDTAPLLDDVKRQLHEEADYLQEAAGLTRFSQHLSHDRDFLVPRHHADLSTCNVLAMDFIDSRPLSDLVTAPQMTRDAVAARLIELVLRELFEFGEMQTDPNFANYRYIAATGQIVLLDFGATRAFPHKLRAGFHDLLIAGLGNDREVARVAAKEVGLFDAQTPKLNQSIILDMLETGMEAFRHRTVFDFGRNDLFVRLRDRGLELATERDFWSVPATDTLLVQRKVAVTYLIAASLKARVDLAEIVGRYL